MGIELRPMDVVVIDGLWYMPHHWAIRSRGQGDKAVHNCIILNSSGDLENVDFINGPHLGDNISHYEGRYLSIHRLKQMIPSAWTVDMLAWLDATRATSKGYDFKQLIAGYFGIVPRWLANDETRWDCAERSYWMLQSNGVTVTGRDEILPHPRWPRYNDHLRCIFEGVWNGSFAYRREQCRLDP